MAIRDLIPWGRQQGQPPVSATSSRSQFDDHPLVSLQRDVNRLFDEMVRGWSLPGFGELARWDWPSVELHEQNGVIELTAELPGMTERDVELSVDDGVLTLRGERREEKKEGDRYSERFYGRFERRIPLPADAQSDKASAQFRDGVLTVTIPRSGAAENRKRIPINAPTQH